jgi:RES domain-containing protein
MIIYRICKSDYKDDITGTGAKLFGSRWNQVDYPMLYTAEHISLAALEMLVHINFNELSPSFYLLLIKVPDTASITELKYDKLKKNWEDDYGYTAWIGSEFIKEKTSLCLKVPSAVVAEEHNYLLNPLHVDFKKVHIQEARPFIFDKRLFHL